MTTTDHAVRTEALVKRFGRQTALAGLDLAVPLGSICLLAGTNGAGKSTLLRTLLNLERPSAGRCDVLGFDPQRQGATVRANVGYVPETSVWGYPWLRVGQMLDHVAVDFAGWDDAYATRLMRALDVLPDRRLGSLSKGQRRCVQIVAALAHRPELLLLDELTDGLDPLVRDTALQAFAGHVAETGCSVILSTHLVSEVERLADHVAIIREGRILFQGSDDALADRFTRLDLDAPSGWSPPPAVEPMLVRTDASIGRSPTLIVAAPRADAERALAGSGATVRSGARVGLSDAVRLTLQSDQGQ